MHVYRFIHVPKYVYLSVYVHVSTVCMGMSAHVLFISMYVYPLHT